MNIAILLSGGRGERIHSEVPKQYLKIRGERMIAYPLRTFLAHPEVDLVIVVAEDEWHAVIGEIIRGGAPYGARSLTFVRDDTGDDRGDTGDDRGDTGDGRDNLGDGRGDTGKFAGFARPGRNRQESILNALRMIRERIPQMNSAESAQGYKSEGASYGKDDIVIIHDAARPLVSAALVSALLAACKEHDGAMPVLPMKDTVYVGRPVAADGADPLVSGKVTQLLDRSTIFAGQAPEAFLFEMYFAANEALTEEALLKVNGSSEVAVGAGMDVVMIPGEELNFKVTTKEDLTRFERIAGQEERRRDVWS